MRRKTWLGGASRSDPGGGVARAGPAPIIGRRGLRRSTLNVMVALLVGSMVVVGPSVAAGAVAALSPPRLVPGPSPRLVSVSCPTATWCVAVGNSETNPNGDEGTLAEAWDGTAWRVQVTPNPGRTESSLAAVSCTSAKACTAVGYADAMPKPNKGTSASLIERWNGLRWTVQGPSRPNVSLNTVSCSSATFCIAIGNDRHGPNRFEESWNGKRWTVRTAPLEPSPKPYQYYIGSLSCRSRWACTAVGGTQLGPNSGPNSSYLPLAEYWNGQKWAIDAVPDPPRTRSSSLADVVCPAPAFCMAVGVVKVANRPYNTLAETLKAGKWTILPTPKTGNSEFASVSCPSERDCFAVGAYKTPRDTWASLVEHWDGTKWTLQSSPDPGGLSAVSCATKNACEAVGGVSLGQFDGVMTVAEGWNGIRWTGQSTPSPSR
jgi:hypothetical protein